MTLTLVITAIVIVGCVFVAGVSVGIKVSADVEREREEALAHDGCSL